MAKTTTAAPKSSTKSILIKIGVIAFIAVFVAVLAFSALRYTTGVVHRAAKAVRIDGEKLSAMDLRIFYNDARNSYLYQYGYILEMYGYDLSTIDSQVCLLDNTMTWGQYFVNQGFTQASNVLTLKILGEKAGFTAPNAEENVAAYIENVKAAAEEEGISVKKYLKNAYGKGTSLKDLEKTALLSEYANAYYEYLTEGYYDGITADEVQAYYEKNKNTYDMHEYYAIKVPYTTYTYKAPAEGQSVPAGQPKSTEEATKMTDDARADAQNLANSIYKEVTMENFETVAKKYWDEQDNDKEFTTALTTYTASDIESLIGKWLSTEGNNVQGFKDVLADPDNSQFIVIMYNRRYLPEVDTINVRHILINTQAIPSDATAEQKAEIEKANADAKAEAERIYTEWKNGAATEESFALLAKKYTEDPGSATEGGLYENVAQGDMVEAFDTWCFDESRKAGDTDIIKSNDYGYHIMYFVGEGLVQYEAQIREALSVEEYNEYYNEQTKDMAVETYDLGTMLMFS